MKTRTILAAALLLSATGIHAQTKTGNKRERTTVEAQGDSIIIIKGKSDLHIKLYEQQTKDGQSTMTEIYDGVYLEQIDTKERSFLDALPFVPNRKRNTHNYEPHLSGIYLGFARLPERIPQFTASNSIPLNLSYSWEFGFNLISHEIAFKNPNWGFNFGVGWGYRSYSFDGNRALVKHDGYSALEKGGIPISDEEGMEEPSYSSSRLRHFFFRIPLLIEGQQRLRKHSAFFNLGPEIEIRHGIKSFTHINGGKKERIGKGMYVHPVSVNMLVQAGYGNWGLYLRYSAIPLFQKDKGPDTYPYSFGLVWFW